MKQIPKVITYLSSDQVETSQTYRLHICFMSILFSDYHFVFNFFLISINTSQNNPTGDCHSIVYLYRPSWTEFSASACFNQMKKQLNTSDFLLFGAPPKNNLSF